MARFTLEEANAVKRLLPYADRKGFVADLILNGYDSSYTVNMRSVMRYAGGEEYGSTYRNDVFVLLGLMERGVESHEVVGLDVIERYLPSALRAVISKNSEQSSHDEDPQKGV